MSLRSTIFTVLLFVTATYHGWSQAYVCANGYVVFRSEAPLEVIVAESRQLKGVLDIEKNTFAFSIEIQSFEGFNSPLQRVHFNENYLESNRFRTASFSGKIIERLDFSQSGTHEVRAKGTFNIHGVEKERIIKGTLKIINESLEISSSFSVLLDVHDIKIPKIVNQKIAKEINVEMNASLLKAKEK